jgi:hypothetical protein
MDGRGWRGRSWGYFGLFFGAATAPMIATTPGGSASTGPRRANRDRRRVCVGLDGVRDATPPFDCILGGMNARPARRVW